MKLSLISVLLLLFFANGPIQSQSKIMVSNNYPPYNYINEDGELVGFNIDILRAISKIYRTDIIIEGGDWNAINKMLDDGEIQGIGGVHYPGTPDNNYIYTRSAINTSHCFIYNADFNASFSIEDFRSLKEPLVAVWNNDVLIHYIKSINPSTKFNFVESYDELVLSLTREDITCIFAQRVPAMYEVFKLGIEDIRPLEHRILERNMGFKVARNDKKLAYLLNNGLEIIFANGEYHNIYNKWIKKYNRNYIETQTYWKQFLIIGLIAILLFFILLFINWVLRSRVKSKTKDLQDQLNVNSKIMKELEEQKVKAEESDKMKSAFLANMSHEIRTPMNGILGFTDLLKTVDFSPEQKQHFYDIIQQSGKRMLATINNIIDISKIESGIEKNNFTKVNIGAIIYQLYNFFKPEVDEKGIDLIIVNKSKIDIKDFTTDEEKLNSILTNLIKNAIKFTKEGSITVTYNVNVEFAEFWVKDTGIGIDESKQSSVFEHFVQADNSISREYEGTGLGLSITKGYVEILGGKITLDSEINKGSTFYVNIPNQQKDQTVNETVNTKKHTGQLDISDYKFIIADDDEVSRLYLSQVLKGIAREIIMAKDGIEVVELAGKHPDTDIILMDIKMPGKNGYLATEEIRKFNSQVFIIAQTAYTQPEYKNRSEESGCNAYISKPIDAKQLMNIIASTKN